MPVGCGTTGSREVERSETEHFNLFNMFLQGGWQAGATPTVTRLICHVSEAGLLKVAKTPSRCTKAISIWWMLTSESPLAAEVMSTGSRDITASGSWSKLKGGRR